MMQMQQNSMQMQQNMMRHSNHFCFFTKNNPRKMKADKNSIKYFDDVHSSYILGISLTFSELIFFSRRLQQDRLNIYAQPERYLDYFHFVS